MPAPSVVVMKSGSRLCVSSEDVSIRSETSPSTHTERGSADRVLAVMQSPSAVVSGLTTILILLHVPSVEPAIALAPELAWRRMTRVFGFVMVASAWSLAVAAQPAANTVRVEVRADDHPIAGAAVTLAEAAAETDPQGIAVLVASPGATRLSVTADGFLPFAEQVTVAGGPSPQTVVVTLVPVPDIDEEVVVVATTRTGRRLEDQPTRVEVLDREEIEEKLLMTPGDIVMMLNEMGGLRVQATSPSIGAASVRVQGMQGRYTRFLGDGLPLFGQQVGGLGLLQIPPMDLGQVEVIKGAASAFYGAGAMGGVVNLLSRRPGPEPAADLLINQSTLGATDAVAYLSSPLGGGWRASLLGRRPPAIPQRSRRRRLGRRRRLHAAASSGHGCSSTAAMAGRRSSPPAPRSRIARAARCRARCSRPGAALRRGARHPAIRRRRQRPDVARRAVRRHRAGGGGVAAPRPPLRPGARARRPRHAVRRGRAARRAGRHTWVAGVAVERDHYDPRDVPRFAYSYVVPGVFAQDDVDLASWLAVSAGAARRRPQRVRHVRQPAAGRR